MESIVATKRKVGRPPKIPKEEYSALVSEALYVKTVPVAAYMNTFVQHSPYYCIKKKPGKDWIAVPNADRKACISELQTLNYLEGRKKRSIAVLGKWYPSYVTTDHDRMKGDDHENIKYIKDFLFSLGMKENQFFIYKSESKNSYHSIAKVLYHNKPPTLRLLDDVLSPLCAEKGIELYPQSSHAIRLPFSPDQACVYPPDFNYETWQAKYHWFSKLDEYDLSIAPKPKQQSFLPMDIPTVKDAGKLSTFSEGKELLECGLQMSGSRNDSQFKVLYYFWRCNHTQENAEKMTIAWLERLHNGKSEEVLRGHWMRISREIHAQATKIWETYILPDDRHTGYFGYLTAPDIPKIWKLAEGSLVRARFIFELLRWYYPRRQRDRVALSQATLLKWSNDRSYLKALDDLSSRGIIDRGTGYIPGIMAKSITMQWEFGTRENALLREERSPSTIEDALCLSLPPRDARSLLITSGMDHSNARKFIHSIYEPEKTDLIKGSIIVA